MKSIRDMPGRISYDYEGVMETLSRVEAAFALRRLKCHSGSAIGSLFASIRRIVNKGSKLSDAKWEASFIKASEAVRILHAVEAVLDDAGAQEAIHRVITSDMSLGTRQVSNGKDALWELDLYRRFKLGKTPIRFEEPDLVVSLGSNFGEFAIACKKIYSLKNVQGRFKEGCEQLETHGTRGVVAFNLDDILPEASSLAFSTEAELKHQLNEFNISFVRSNEHHFAAMGVEGPCDGVLVSTSCIADVQDMNPPRNVIRSSASWTNRTQLAEQGRFGAFLECHDRICEVACD